MWSDPAPVYDGSRNVTVVGEVTSFRFVNPHALLDVADDAGKVVAWTVEFSGRLNLVNAGWTESTILVGERFEGLEQERQQRIQQRGQASGQN